MTRDTEDKAIALLELIHFVPLAPLFIVACIGCWWYRTEDPPWKRGWR